MLPSSGRAQAEGSGHGRLCSFTWKYSKRCKQNSCVISALTQCLNSNTNPLLSCFSNSKLLFHVLLHLKKQSGRLQFSLCCSLPSSATQPLWSSPEMRTIPQASVTHVGLMAEEKHLVTMHRKDAAEVASQPGKAAHLHSH